MSRPKSSTNNARPNSSNKPVVVRNSLNLNNSIHNSKRQIVGQYMIGKTIGEGTFGKVKLAVHIPTGEKVAIKILEKSKIKEQADVRRVNREIKILKKTRHGNIIQLYEVLDTKSTIFLIMECAEGGEMFDFIVAQKRVPEIQACKFFHQIIDGLEILHKNEITHRDLKPENLLLKASPDGWIVKIVDFGLSNTHEGGKLLATACGSPCYAAPEMIAGKKYFGPLADLWSVGVILFALVSGYLPFEDPNTSILYKKILSCDYSTPKWISSEVKDLISLILEVDPKKRYTIDNIRKHVWYNIVSESSIPHDDVHSKYDTRSETLTAIQKSGLDTQAVLDSLASHAFNSLTAMYYLFEQKHQVLALQSSKKSESKTQIRQNSSTLSKTSNPETITTTTTTIIEGNDNNKNKENINSNKKPQIVPTNNNNINIETQFEDLSLMNLNINNISTSRPYSGDTTNAVSNSIPPLKSPITTTTTASTTANNLRNESSFKAHTQPTIAPYLQRPIILQQQYVVNKQQQASSKNPKMPSLDVYLKNNLALPTTTDTNTTDTTIATINTTTKPSNVLHIPPLNLTGTKPDDNNNIIAATTKGVSTLHNNILVSQTSRQDDSTSTNKKPLLVIYNEELTSQTARAAIPTVIAVDTDVTTERPNTRRSHLRSRGNDELAPAIGTLDEGINGNNNSSIVPMQQQQPSPLGVIQVITTTTSDGQTNSLNNKIQSNIRPAPFVVNAASKIQASINNNNNNNSSAVNPVKLQAPEAPKSSSNNIGGGRGGRNISITNSNNATTTATTNSIKTNTNHTVKTLASTTPLNIINNLVINNIQSNTNSNKVYINSPNSNNIIKPTPPLIKSVQ